MHGHIQKLLLGLIYNHDLSYNLRTQCILVYQPQMCIWGLKNEPLDESVDPVDRLYVRLWPGSCLLPSSRKPPLYQMLNCDTLSLQVSMSPWTCVKCLLNVWIVTFFSVCNHTNKWWKIITVLTCITGHFPLGTQGLDRLSTDPGFEN